MSLEIAMRTYTNLEKNIRAIEETPHAPSVEYPGYAVSFHPKPDDLEPREWFDVLRYHYTTNGHIILHLLAAVQYEKDPFDPYPLENKVKAWGIDVVYRSIDKRKT